MSNISTLMDLLFSGARQRVLAQLLLNPQESFHLRELARLTVSHAGTLGRELDKLTETGLVLRSEQGNQVRYQANSRHPLFDDLAALFRKTHGVVPALRDALAPLGEQIPLALVFGSMARGTPSPGSDIDLLVLADDLGFAELVRTLFPLHELLRREVNPVLYAPSEFVARLRRGDAFARELMDKPKLFVKGDKDDLAELVGDQTTANPHA
jgi:predicted nucleotidyltransferase